MRPAPTTRLTVTRYGLTDAVAALLAEDLRLGLVSAVAEEGRFRVVYVFLGPHGRRVELTTTCPLADPWLPSLADQSYPAGRFERELRDLFGIEPRGHPRLHRLVRQPHWPAGYHPLAPDAVVPDPFPPPGTVAHAAVDGATQFPIVEVSGPGVYEIPVGPVHAGLIEPGHFRFSAVGETIVQMSEQLYFMHRGVERLFVGRTPEAGLRLAERISGDTAVGHGLAYVQAVEDALGIDVSERDQVVRALLLEAERMYNHVADLGAIVNDVGFGIVNTHAGHQRELLLRHNEALTGHRLLRGGVRVGGSALVGTPDVALINRVAGVVADLAAISTGHAMVLNRLETTAVLPLEDARLRGTLGYVARASGLDVDARRDQPFLDLSPSFRVVTRSNGDVLDRFWLRAEEFAVSAALYADLAGRLTDLDAAASATPAEGAVPEPASGVGPSGLGVVEAWRGTLVHRVELDSAGRLAAVKVVDPSFFNWPALPVALADVIVPDFPVANKSFNCSYAGNDL